MVGLVRRIALLAVVAIGVLAGCAQPSGKGELVKRYDENGNPYWVREDKPANAQANNTGPAKNEPGKPAANGDTTDPEFCLLPPDANPIAASGLKVGSAAPTWTLKDLRSDKKYSLADLHGRTVMLVFWASWCPACRFAAEENLRPLYNSNLSVKESKLAILGVGLNFNDDTAAAQKALAETKNYTWPLCYDDGGKVAEAYGIGVTPAVVVITPEGKVATFGLYRHDWASRLDAYLTQSCVAEAK